MKMRLNIQDNQFFWWLDYIHQVTETHETSEIYQSDNTCSQQASRYAFIFVHGPLPVKKMGMLIWILIKEGEAFKVDERVALFSWLIGTKNFLDSEKDVFKDPSITANHQICPVMYNPWKDPILY